MKKLNFLGLLAVLAIVLGFYSCTNEESVKNKEKESSNRRDEVRELVSLHSKGLDYFYEDFNENARESKKNGRGVDFKVSDEYIERVVQSFSEKENLILDYEGEKGLVEVSLGDCGFSFSQSFYKLCEEVTNVEGRSLGEVGAKIDGILSSDMFKGLSDIEKDIVLLSAETYLDSYAYWNKKAIKWAPLSLNPNKKFELLSHRGGKTIQEYAKADAWGAVKGGLKGAALGAIRGAVTGAVVGSFAGGVGAGPGALSGAGAGALRGAARGAVSGAVKASVLKACTGYAVVDPELEARKQLDEEFSETLITIPEEVKEAFERGDVGMVKIVDGKLVLVKG